MASSTAVPASTCARFLRVASSIILGERSIAVIVPVVSLSHTRETATPWPQPTSSRRSVGPTSSVSTAQTNRSDALPAMPEQLHHAPVKPRLIYSMSVSVDGCIADRDGAFGWTAPSEERFRFHLAQVGDLGGSL